MQNILNILGRLHLSGRTSFTKLISACYSLASYTWFCIWTELGQGVILRSSQFGDSLFHCDRYENKWMTENQNYKTWKEWETQIKT